MEGLKIFNPYIETFAGATRGRFETCPYTVL